MNEKVRLEEASRVLAQYLSSIRDRRFNRLKKIVFAEIVLVAGIIFFGTVTQGMGFVALVLGLVALGLIGLIFKEDAPTYDSKEYTNWKSAATEYFKESGVDVATLSPGIDSNHILFHNFEGGNFYAGEIYEGFGNVNGDYTEIELRLTGNGEYLLISAGKEIKPQA